MQTKQTAHQFLKFVLIGCCSLILNYGTFFISFKKLSLNYLLASALGYAAGLVISYTFNRLWTFKSKEENKTKEFSLFITVYLISLGLSLITLKVLVGTFQLSPLLANLFAIGVSTVSNFTGLKLFVFRTSFSDTKTDII